jgi:hypothetical protein
MADKNKKNTEQRQRPKGYEIRESLKPKKPVRTPTPALEELGAEATDSYLSRNEFKEGFYDQPDRPPITAETMYGTGTTRQLDESIMSPDDSMLVEYRKGGGLIAKGCGKVMKDRRKVTKMY